MESIRFDSLAQSIAKRLSRRTAVASLSSVLLGVAKTQRVGPDAVARRRRRRRRRRCRTSCPPCQQCNRRSGRCQSTGDGSACGECRICESGQCVVAPNGATCSECLVCDSGACTQVAPDGTVCRGDGQCGSGRCFEPPACAPAGGDCSDVGDLPCCSGFCLPIFPLGGVCTESQTGDPCLSDADCIPGLTCRTFVCG
jgi:hypothetical protein